MPRTVQRLPRVGRGPDALNFVPVGARGRNRVHVNAHGSATRSVGIVRSLIGRASESAKSSGSDSCGTVEFDATPTQNDHRLGAHDRKSDPRLDDNALKLGRGVVGAEVELGLVQNKTRLRGTARYDEIRRDTTSATRHDEVRRDTKRRTTKSTRRDKTSTHETSQTQ